MNWTLVFTNDADIKIELNSVCCSKMLYIILAKGKGTAGDK